MTFYHAKVMCASELGPLWIYALYKLYWLIDCNAMRAYDE